jgi:N-dimethylarginine dimethylaminohydrolase
MPDPIPNRNWGEFYETLMSVGPSHLRPTEIGECVEAESQGGGEAFYSEDAFLIISYGQEDSVEGDVRAALDAWLEEIAKVMVYDLQADEVHVQTVHLEDVDALVARLVASLAVPFVDEA